MNVVALRRESTDHRPRRHAAGRLARVEVFDDMASAEPHWRALERAQALATPYQRYEFLALWQRHVGADAGFTPFIVVGFDVRRDAAVPAAAWLAARSAAGRVVEFLGGKHANFNMGLWRRDVAATIGADDAARGTQPPRRPRRPA